MKLQIPDYVYNIINKFQKEGFEIFIVGGAVRDLLMGKLVYDWDFTTNATPQEILNLFPNAYYDNAYGTVGIPPNEKGERPYEITTYRKESGYSDIRHPDNISWGKSIEEDLSRREATISAIALTINPKDNKYDKYKKNT
jgi:tRNA nucleotidyltransferase/poly(A) polymerase